MQHGSTCPAAPEPFLSEAEVRALAPGFPGTIWYVAPAGPTGDGTRAAPFTSVDEALALSAPGDVIALGVGDHLGGLVVGRPVALVGSCVTGTALLAPSPDDDLPTVELVGPGPTLLANLAVRGDRPAVRVDQASGLASLRALRLEAPRRAGLWVRNAGTVAAIEQVIATGVTPASTGDGGLGLRIEYGAQVTSSGFVVEGGYTAGIGIFDPGTVVELLDSRVTGIVPRLRDQAGGYGVEITEGASATLERLSIHEVVRAGVEVFARGPGGEATSAVLRDVYVRDLTPPGAEYGAGLVAADGAQVTFERLAIRAVPGLGLLVHAGAVVTGTAFSATELPELPGGSLGTGVLVATGGEVSLQNAIVAAVHETGMGAGTSEAAPAGLTTLLHVEDTLILDVAPIDGTSGAGLVAQAGSHLEVLRVAILETAHLGVYVGPGNATAAVAPSEGRLEDLLVHGVRGPVPPGQDPLGIAVRDGGQLVLRRVSIEQATAAALSVSGAGGIRERGPTRLDAEDLTLHNGTGPEDEVGGGIGLSDGAEARIVRLEATDLDIVAISMSGDRPSLELVDATIRRIGTRGTEEPHFGSGVQLFAGVLRIERMVIEQATGVGLLALGTPERLDATDLTVRDTRLLTEGAGVDQAGFGIGLGDGVAATLSRVTVDRSRTFGLFVIDAGTSFAASDLLVTNTTSEHFRGAGGQGLDLGEGATGELTRCRIAGSQELGLFVNGGGALAPVRELIVEDTAEADCAPSCALRAGGAIGVSDGHLELENFLLRRSALFGINVVQGATLFARNGVIAEGQIGVNVSPSASLDLDAAFDNVESRDNEIDVETTELPLPGGSAGLAGVLPSP